jgi:hypothetical protein
MRILSIDPGIRNLAYCILEVDRDISEPVTYPVPKIIKWEVGDLCADVKKPTFYQVSKCLIAMLHDDFGGEEYDHVLIENVPSLANPILKSVSMIIYSFFEIHAFQTGHSCNVRMVSATNKLKVKQVPRAELEAIVNARSTNKYRQRKLLSVEFTRHYLKHVLNNEEQLVRFNADKKRDDKADTLLQAMYSLEIGDI